jgi:hypothetical protein
VAIQIERTQSFRKEEINSKNELHNYIQLANRNNVKDYIDNIRLSCIRSGRTFSMRACNYPIGVMTCFDFLMRSMWMLGSELGSEWVSEWVSGGCSLFTHCVTVSLCHSVFGIVLERERVSEWVCEWWVELEMTFLSWRIHMWVCEWVCVWV